MAEQQTTLNRNATWANHPAFIAMYLTLFIAFHFILLSFTTANLAWTATLVVHSAVTFMMLHWLKGAPFETMDEGESERLTQWEQLASSAEMSQTKRFLIVFPVVLFLLAIAYTHHDNTHFIINFVATIAVLIPKLAAMRGVRLFNINKY